MTKLDKKAQELVLQAARRQVVVEQRALEVFSQLTRLPAFQRWMEEHIIIRDEVDEAKRQITTYVIYKETAADKAAELAARPLPESAS